MRRLPSVFSSVEKVIICKYPKPLGVYLVDSGMPMHVNGGEHPHLATARRLLECAATQRVPTSTARAPGALRVSSTTW